MAAKENFFKAHWDWLAAGVAGAVFVFSVVVFIGRLGTSPEEGAERCAMSLKAAKPAHDGVAPADMTLFQNVFRTAKNPPALVEVDARKANFLASEMRIACKAEEGAADAAGKAVKGCGRPIPADMESCPFCGVKQDTGIKKEDAAKIAMANWSARYKVDLVNKPDNDSDRDGFTDMEEYEAKTIPTDTASHPDYLESMVVSGEMKQTFLPFFFQTVNPVPNGYRYSFRDPSKKNAYGQAGVNYSVLAGEEIAGSGFVAGKYEKKSAEKVVPGSKGKLKKKVDVSTVELNRKADGKKIVAVIGERRIPVDRQVTLVLKRGAEKTFTVKVGDEIDVFGTSYRVVEFSGEAANPAVLLENAKTKAKATITSSGKKSEN